MAGAGISVSVGIPDFRTPGTGLYDNLQKYDLPSPEAIFTIDYFRKNPAPFYALAKELYPGQFVPSPTHYFIRLLADKGKLLRCYTQNIDSLESIAGVPAEKIVAAHGNFDTAKQIDTGKLVDVDEVREAILAGESGWRSMVEKHGGLVKPDIVFFGEALPDRFHTLMQEDFPRADLLIVMGTSLKVQPFASLVNHVGPLVPRCLWNREEAGVADPEEKKLMAKMQLLGLGAGNFAGAGDGFVFEGTECYRDVFAQGDCDDTARQFAACLGWADDLNTLISRESARITANSDLKKATDDVKLAEDPEPLPSFKATPETADSPFTDLKHVSGCWRGEMIAADGEKAPIEWVLSMIADRPDGSVSAVGAAAAPNPSGEKLEYALLHGRVDFAAATVALKVVAAVGASRPSEIVFSGVLENPHNPHLRGSWKATNADAEGTFQASLAPCGPREHAGLWRGEAVPQAGQEGDCPCNPITWALHIRESSDGNAPRVVGAGFFDDSGDIPGHSTLFYTIRDAEVQEDGKLAMVKVYEPPVPPDLVVNYISVSLTNASGVQTLSGSWANPLEGTSGAFAAALENN